MWRRFALLSTAMPLLGLTAMANVVCAADPPDLVQQLLERIRVLEERLNRLEQVDVIKKAVEYVCPSGEILDQPPPNGRCPDGSRPQIRETVRKSSITRRESIAAKIESALQDAEAKKVAISGVARGGVQQVINGRDGQNKLFGEGSLDVTFLARPMARTTLFVDLEAIAGPGPDQRLGSLSRVNTDAETLGGQDEKLTAREVWLGLRFINDRLDLFGGKLDATNYFDRNAFANDETSQFLNSALKNNPLLKQPPNGPGAVVRWDAGRDLGFSLGAHAPNDLGKDLAGGPYVIGEIDLHSARFIDGHYRLWARTSTLPTDHRRQTWGAGISVDQRLTPQFGVFGRAGFSLIEGVGRTSYAASTGFQWTGPLWDRPRDRLGVGYSFQREVQGEEQLAEAYYNMFLTDRFSVIGNVEWLFTGPNQVTGKTNRDVIIPGVRAVVGF